MSRLSTLYSFCAETKGVSWWCSAIQWQSAIAQPAKFELPGGPQTRREAPGKAWDQRCGSRNTSRRWKRQRPPTRRSVSW